MRLARCVLVVAALALAAGGMPGRIEPSAAQTRAANEAEASEIEIVVTGYRDIVVNGRAVRCRTAPGDPLDRVSVPGWSDYMMIVPNSEGGFVTKRVTEQITGPEFWQRVGVGMGAYRFRAPRGGQPMCIGGRGGADSFGGFRRIVDAAPYRGHRLRFTAWVATGEAEQMSFWLAACSNRLLNGGNSNNVRFGGNRGWTPVLLETGPIHKEADHVSYGFNLQGSGDVWVHEPKLEIVAEGPENMRAGDLIVIGRDQG